MAQGGAPLGGEFSSVLNLTLAEVEEVLGGDTQLQSMNMVRPRRWLSGLAARERGLHGRSARCSLQVQAPRCPR